MTIQDITAELLGAFKHNLDFTRQVADAQRRGDTKMLERLRDEALRSLDEARKMRQHVR